MVVLLEWIGSVVSNFTHIAAGLFGIGFLIAFHELGHYSFCKLFGIHTPSFSIGFGPAVFSKKIGDTNFIIAPIPLGGYVEIAGSAEVGQGEQEHAQLKDERSFAAKPYYQKLLVMLGGIMFNLIFAYTVFIGIFMTGIPDTPLMARANSIPVVARVISAEIEGQTTQNPLQEGDKIVSFNNEHVTNETVPALTNTIRSLPDQSVPITILRDGKEITFNIDVSHTQALGKKIGTLNIIFKTEAKKPFPFFESIKRGIKTTNEYITLYCSAYLNLFKKATLKGVGGPLMLISQTVGGAAEGLSVFLIYLAVISINLAVLNLIPLPILDGGQILFNTIEAIARRPLPLQVKWYIHLATWFAILGLIIYLSFFDILHLLYPLLTKLKGLAGA